MVNNDIFGYIGLIFAITYRLPQMIKIYKTNILYINYSINLIMEVL